MPIGPPFKFKHTNRKASISKTDKNCYNEKVCVSFLQVLSQTMIWGNTTLLVCDVCPEHSSRSTGKTPMSLSASTSWMYDPTQTYPKNPHQTGP